MSKVKSVKLKNPLNPNVQRDDVLLGPDGATWSILFISPDRLTVRLLRRTTSEARV